MTGGSPGSVERSVDDLYKGISAHSRWKSGSRGVPLRSAQRHKSDHERRLDEIRDIVDDFTGGAEATSALAGPPEAWF